MNTPNKAGRTRKAKAARKLTAAEMFFYEHAGYSYKAPETAEQGRIRCAKKLAEAERYASNLGWYAEWTNDWGVGSHEEYYGEGSAYEDREPETCESCRLLNESGEFLTSVGCVDDADSNDRRVIEAELASEALHEYDKEIDTLDAH